VLVYWAKQSRRTLFGPPEPVQDVRVNSLTMQCLSSRHAIPLRRDPPPPSLSGDPPGLSAMPALAPVAGGNEPRLRRRRTSSTRGPGLVGITGGDDGGARRRSVRREELPRCRHSGREARRWRWWSPAQSSCCRRPPSPPELLAPATSPACCAGHDSVQPLPTTSPTCSCPVRHLFSSVYS
jgi:hypothetical protein